MSSEVLQIMINSVNFYCAIFDQIDHFVTMLFKMNHPVTMFLKLSVFAYWQTIREMGQVIYRLISVFSKSIGSKIVIELK